MMEHGVWGYWKTSGNGGEKRKFREAVVCNKNWPFVR